MLQSISPSSANSLSVSHTRKNTHKLLHQAIQQQDYSTAIHLLSYLIVQEPQTSKHYSNRGLMHYHRGKWPQAMRDYNQALQINPNDDRIYAYRARCNIALEHWDAAIADYDFAIDINPHNVQTRLHQGVLFRALQMYDDAIVCFDLALFLGKLNAHIYAERGRTYQLIGHWNCAFGDYQKALELLCKAPSSPLKSQIQAWISELLPSQ
ncbi:tetratricopeptide repeat protein [Leptolyngbyaceae cyanobacterium CCMR0082]|uniref:Tetratricopeptide repeat protein n=1 Tax=Adonisia turfae CCMR0082 TaxID=2304604 RepID=A0A6M0S277_9CYAN|nr:tetratricopeptide repeat protein [Adonisia turfae]NEZ62575.1 tetratricopeptide repeat protein [Adonisia turfae CCMR0082]